MKFRVEPNTLHLMPVKIVQKKSEKNEGIIVPGRMSFGKVVEADSEIMHVSQPIRFYKVLAAQDETLVNKIVMAYQSRILTAHAGVHTIHLAEMSAVIAVCEKLDANEKVEELKF